MSVVSVVLEAATLANGLSDGDPAVEVPSLAKTFGCTE